MDRVTSGCIPVIYARRFHSSRRNFRDFDKHGNVRRIDVSSHPYCFHSCDWSIDSRVEARGRKVKPKSDHKDLHRRGFLFLGFFLSVS